MATTYSIGHSVSQRLRVAYMREAAPPHGSFHALCRLEDGKGTEEDVRRWVDFCEACGETELAELLRSLVSVEASPPEPSPAAAMRNASERLEYAMSTLEDAENEGREDLEREAVKRLVRATAEHTRALAALFAAHMEARR